MDRSDDERPVAHEARLRCDDPRVAGGLGAGRPAPPRAYRRTRAWWALVIGVAVLITGMVLSDGLLIATGLVLTGSAVQLLDST